MSGARRTEINAIDPRVADLHEGLAPLRATVEEWIPRYVPLYDTTAPMSTSPSTGPEFGAGADDEDDLAGFVYRVTVLGVCWRPVHGAGGHQRSLVRQRSRHMRSTTVQPLKTLR